MLKLNPVFIKGDESQEFISKVIGASASSLNVNMIYKI